MPPMKAARLITPLDAALDALDNEVVASNWAIRSMCEHIHRIEEELAVERRARGMAETRAMLLETRLLASEPAPTQAAVSGVRVRAREV